MNAPELPPSPDSLASQKYEISDVWQRPILMFAVGLMILLGLIMSVAGFLRRTLDAAARRPAASTRPEAQVTPRHSRPRLQVQPTADLVELRAREDAILSRYEVISDAGPTFRIPIELAIELLSERGFPERELTPESSDRRETSQ